MRPFVTLLICVALAESAAARTEFPIYGAQGDKGATDEFPAGSFLVGLVGAAGSWVDQITVVCGQQRSDGSISGSTRLVSRGGSGGSLQTALCGTNEVVTEISLQRTKNCQIAAIFMKCTNVRTLSTQPKPFGAVGEVASPLYSCKSGELGSGLNIRYGKHVNGIGLICGDCRPVAAPSPSPIAQLCRDFGARQAARDDEYARLNCRGWAGARATAAQHESECLRKGANAAGSIKYTEIGLQSVIDARKNGSPGGVAVTKTVVRQVTLYNRPAPPQTECYLSANDRLTVLSGADIPQAFRNLDDKKWVPVKGASGGCNARIGGVHDDGQLR